MMCSCYFFVLGRVHTIYKQRHKCYNKDMILTEKQFEKVKDQLPRQRGNVSMPNLQVLNAILYVAEQGCKWRGLPKEFGNWHTIYVRMNRWAKAGVLDRVFIQLQRAQIIKVTMEVLCLDSTSVKVHPDGTGALKKVDLKVSESHVEVGQQRFIWLPRMIEQP